MIFDVNEESLDLLAITACPGFMRVDGCCMLENDDLYNYVRDSSAIDTCRACWLKWLSKESEDNHE